jgi:uncharacterized damage-inducible protein DinB
MKPPGPFEYHADMTYYGPKEIALSFRKVRQNTIQVAEDIPENQYSFQPASGTRTVAQTLAHIATLSRFQREMANVTSFEGLDFGKIRAQMAEEEAKPRTKAELIQWLRDSGEDYARWVEMLKEDVLGQVFTFPAGAQPPSRTRFDMLLSVKEHEMHHRAQLMMIERILGIKPHLTRQHEERMAAMQAQQARPA